MRLDHLHTRRRHAGFRISTRQCLRVRGLHRSAITRISVNGISVRRTDTTDNGIYTVTIALGIGEALEHDTRRAFTGHRAIGRHIKRTRHAIARIGAQRIGCQHRTQVAGQINRAREHHIEFAPPQRARRHLDCAQARGILAANRMARAADVKLARDPARDNPAERAQRAIRRQRQAGAVAQLRAPCLVDTGPGCAALSVQSCAACPFGRALFCGPAKMKISGAKIKAEADKDATPCRAQRRTASVLNRRLRNIEHEQLLRQHFRHFTWWNVETINRH